MRRVDKSDLRRIAKSTGATLITTLANDEGVENFDPSWLGTAESVYEEPVGDWDFCFIEVSLSSLSILKMTLGFHQSFCLYYPHQRCQRTPH